MRLDRDQRKLGQIVVKDSDAKLPDDLKLPDNAVAAINFFR